MIRVFSSARECQKKLLHFYLGFKIEFVVVNFIRPPVVLHRKMAQTPSAVPMHKEYHAFSASFFNIMVSLVATTGTPIPWPKPEDVSLPFPGNAVPLYFYVKPIRKNVLVF